MQVSASGVCHITLRKNSIAKKQETFELLSHSSKSTYFLTMIGAKLSLSNHMRGNMLFYLNFNDYFRSVIFENEFFSVYFGPQIRLKKENSNQTFESVKFLGILEAN